MKKSIQITIISIIIGILVMSCNLVSNFPGLTKNVPTSTQVPLSLPTQLLVEPTIVISNDNIIVSFTETDVLSWINQYQASNPGIVLKDPGVKMDNGIAQISGKVDSGFISGDVSLDFSVDVGADGAPKITIIKMEIGGMDLPQSSKEKFSTTINESIVQAMKNELGGRTIQSVTIDDGRMTIQTSN